MSFTDLQYLGTVLLKNISHGHGTDALQAFIDHEGDTQLAFARALEVEASNIMFKFSAGDVGADKSVYAKNLTVLAGQVRKHQAEYSGDLSTAVSWSGSASFGSAEVVDTIDLDYNAPNW